MSHVFAARALVPGMLARGSGYLLNTASAAGLLASLNSMPYGVTKHAAVAWPSISPFNMATRNPRFRALPAIGADRHDDPRAERGQGRWRHVSRRVARIVIEAMEAERFLILSHPQVHEYVQRKALLHRPLDFRDAAGCATGPMALRIRADTALETGNSRAPTGNPVGRRSNDY